MAPPLPRPAVVEQFFVRTSQVQAETSAAEASAGVLPAVGLGDGGLEHSKTASVNPSLPPAVAPAASVNLPEAARDVGAIQHTPVAEQISHAILARLEVVSAERRIDFHLHLNPPELGRVRVQLSLTEQTLTARLIVHEDASRQLIQSQLESLRQRLVEAGLAVGAFDVTGGGGDERGRWRQHEPLPEPYDYRAPAAPAVPERVAPAPARLVAGQIDVMV